MKVSELFSKTSKNYPSDETSKNAQLLIQAGYIHKEMAGVYAFLPLGLKVVEKIKAIVREEINAIGGQELTMTSLQRKELWEKTDRWDDKNVDIWFKTKLQSGNDLGLAWSHEEPITDMMRDFISSYRDLPVYTYQFQNKLRNELRAKSGIMRCREFIMKDLYSYSLNEEEHQKFYDQAIKAYRKIFEKAGIGESTYFTFASGGAFTQFSHEFQTVCEAGEDVIYVDEEKKMAVNKEVLSDEVLSQLGLTRSKLVEKKAAEVGNIFSFGTKKSEQLDLFFTDENGNNIPVTLGSYGIGITRLMGVLVEKLADERGIVWPENIAPFKVYLAAVGEGSDVKTAADNLYKELKDSKVEVLYDDRDVRPGEKFADADLLGIPYRVVISAKTLENSSAEVKKRTEKELQMIDLSQIKNKLEK